MDDISSWQSTTIKLGLGSLWKIIVVFTQTIKAIVAIVVFTVEEYYSSLDPALIA